ARPVGADDRDLIAPREAELLQADRKSTHLLEHLRPGPHLPDAEVLVPIGRAARVKASVAYEELGERVCGFGRHGNPPFTASSPAGRQALPAVCRQAIVAHKKLGVGPGQVSTWCIALPRGRSGKGARRPRGSGLPYSAALSSGAGPARSC